MIQVDYATLMWGGLQVSHTSLENPLLTSSLPLQDLFDSSIKAYFKLSGGHKTGMWY